MVNSERGTYFFGQRWLSSLPQKNWPVRLCDRDSACRMLNGSMHLWQNI